jgi:hypothetical protein
MRHAHLINTSQPRLQGQGGTGWDEVGRGAHVRTHARTTDTSTRTHTQANRHKHTHTHTQQGYASHIKATLSPTWCLEWGKLPGTPHHGPRESHWGRPCTTTAGHPVTRGHGLGRGGTNGTGRPRGRHRGGRAMPWSRHEQSPGSMAVQGHGDRPGHTRPTTHGRRGARHRATMGRHGDGASTGHARAPRARCQHGAHSGCRPVGAGPGVG